MEAPVLQPQIFHFKTQSDKTEVKTSNISGMESAGSPPTKETGNTQKNRPSSAGVRENFSKKQEADQLVSKHPNVPISGASRQRSNSMNAVHQIKNPRVSSEQQIPGKRNAMVNLAMGLVCNSFQKNSANLPQNHLMKNSFETSPFNSSQNFNKQTKPPTASNEFHRRNSSQEVSKWDKKKIQNVESKIKDQVRKDRHDYGSHEAQDFKTEIFIPKNPPKFTKKTQP